MTAASRAFSSCSSTRPWSYPRQQQPGWNEPGEALCYQLGARDREQRTGIERHHGLPVRSKACRSLQGLMFAVLFSILLCLQGVEAGHVHNAKRLEGRPELLFDRSEPPVPSPRLQLIHRRETTSSLASGIPAPSRSVSVGSTLQTAAPTSSTSLPSPFDTSLGNNFTTPSCPAFFESFLTNSTFQDCLPFSLLLQVSHGRITRLFAIN